MDGDKGFCFLSLGIKIMYGAIRAIYAFDCSNKKEIIKTSHNNNSCKSNNNRSVLATFSVGLFVCLFCCFHLSQVIISTIRDDD